MYTQERVILWSRFYASKRIGQSDSYARPRRLPPTPFAFSLVVPYSISGAEYAKRLRCVGRVTWDTADGCKDADRD